MSARARRLWVVGLFGALRMAGTLGSVADDHICIVGAGPGGIQLAYFLQQADRDYTVFERSAGPGSFFKRYPRHRKLISINKIHTGSTNPEFNMRHDWNSLVTNDDRILEPSLRFGHFDQDYFPHADSMVKYLEHFATTSRINVNYNTTVQMVARAAVGSGFTLTVQDSSNRAPRDVPCTAVVIATGLPVLRRVHPFGDPDGVIEYYDNVSVRAEDFNNQEVVVFGRGNSALEVAQHIYGNTARVHNMARTRLKLSWETHYVGHIRGVNNEVLDSYMLKSLDVTGLIGDADGARFDRDPSTGRIRIWFPDSAENKWYELPEMSQCHRVIACLGWRFDTSIFNDATLPRMKTDQYPLLTPEYESINVPGLFFAGTLMHSRDKPRSSGGFIHGFRYLVRALSRQLESRIHNTAWPAREIPCDKTSTFAKPVLRRLHEMSGPYQMFGNLVDVIILPNQTQCVGTGRTALALHEVPIDYIPVAVRRVVPTGPVRFITVSLEYGRGFSGPGHDVFDPDKIGGGDFKDPRGPGGPSNFLHPIFRLHHFGSDAGGESWINTGAVDPADLINALQRLANPLPARAQSAASVNELLSAVAEAVGLTSTDVHNRVLGIVCPDDEERARSVCFEKTVIHEHHMLETARVEFWNEKTHVKPFTDWLSQVLPWFRTPTAKSVADISHDAHKSHLTERKTLSHELHALDDPKWPRRSTKFSRTEL